MATVGVKGLVFCGTNYGISFVKQNHKLFFFEYEKYLNWRANWNDEVDNLLHF